MSINFECPVCLEEIKKINMLKQLDCDHIFCVTCINKIKDNDNVKCPICRIDSSLSQNDDEIRILTKEEIREYYKQSMEMSKAKPKEIYKNTLHDIYNSYSDEENYLDNGYSLFNQYQLSNYCSGMTTTLNDHGTIRVTKDGKYIGELKY